MTTATKPVKLLSAAMNAHDLLVDICEFLTFGTPIRSGSDLHTEVCACRDQLSAAIDAAESRMAEHHATRSAVTKRVFEERQLRRPAGQARHMIGIDHKGDGFFVVNNDGMVLNREAYREIAAEARRYGVARHEFYIYGRVCAYHGPGIEFLQIGAE